MFVDFVNMFADPTGFFSAAPLWLAFVIPGVITAVPVALVWWRLGCPAWEATFKGGTSIIIGVSLLHPRSQHMESLKGTP